MRDYGGESAASLIRCLNDCLKEFVSGDRTQQNMVSVCCDGASVNLGWKQGIYSYHLMLLLSINYEMVNYCHTITYF